MVSMFSVFAGLLLLQGVSAGQGGGTALRTDGFVRALEFNYRLRVCNAYPIDTPLEVFHGKERLTGDDNMPYKSCRDFSTPLKSNDKLEFKAGEAAAGTFSFDELPQNDATLLIIVSRHDIVSTAMSFISHVFANSEKTQVAVLDTYKGKAKSTPEIEEQDQPLQKDKDGKPLPPPPKHKEMLRYNSVVVVDQGLYQVELTGDDDKQVKGKTDLVALKKESYVVFRAGVESKSGKLYPEDVIVFPQSDPAKILKSGASRAVLFAPLLLLAACFWM
eukprot:gnl/TRDRNA2_/TRDRNA2_154628_c0_seq1.p1 gnl/TRDRNA2_/TRDRNA2_154628_c0~~gnl/TRDRNA2_/TRDRNA2_154628_c0_seq1.p1  ORF type:complete len:275 (-),score=78.98 gnl/TRDRNA2_/TRDRNA2_154628_c0_seq1:190-1014(-)